MAEGEAKQESSGKKVQYFTLMISIILTTAVLLFTECIFDTSILLKDNWLLVVLLAIAMIIHIVLIFGPVGDKISKIGSIICTIAVVFLLIMLIYRRNKVTLLWIGADSNDPDTAKKLAPYITPSGVLIMLNSGGVGVTEEMSKVDISNAAASIQAEFTKALAKAAKKVKKATAEKTNGATPEESDKGDIKSFESDPELLEIIKNARFSGITKQAVWNITSSSADAEAAKKAGFSEFKK
ncbi:hypothetical protein PAEPH01_1045 [Pancytospora epiphaga]|nr:hypothetical protein PAEPH01_1045 [Pancytospora epiphaga]